MKQVLVCKGQYEIIREAHNAPRAHILYDSICNFFSKRNYDFRLIETNSEKRIPEYISKETEYIIGHSNGTLRILREFVPEDYPGIKGLILFDTRLDYLARLEIRSLVFLSARWQSQTARAERAIIINIHDDHYFNDSFGAIGREMELFIA